MSRWSVSERARSMPSPLIDKIVKEAACPVILLIHAPDPPSSRGLEARNFRLPERSGRRRANSRSQSRRRISRDAFPIATFDPAVARRPLPGEPAWRRAPMRHVRGRARGTATRSTRGTARCGEAADGGREREQRLVWVDNRWERSTTSGPNRTAVIAKLHQSMTSPVPPASKRLSTSS